MLLYTFTDKSELIRALRTFAIERRARACAFSSRSHKASELMAEARTYDSVASMLLTSNVTVANVG